MTDLFLQDGSTMPLRPYQLEAKDLTVKGFEEATSQLVVIPTGGGKTILFAHLAAHYAPGRTLIIAHREELLIQAKDKIQKAVGLPADIEKAEQRASLDATVVVASVQTLRSKRLERWPVNHFDLIVIDEAHHVLALSYKTVLEHFKGARVLGVTATPDRGDKKNLGQVFERVAFECSLVRLIREGYLVPITVRMLPVKMNLTECKSIAGDLSADDVAKQIEPWLERVAQGMAVECWDRKTIVFLPLVRTAQRMAAILAERGFESRSVSGYDDNRAETLEWFSKSGAGSVLCNAMLLTEGYDEPSVDCIVNLRPTKVRALFSQMVGRGTRLSPSTGKVDLLLLDFLWQTGRMSLACPANLITGNVEDVKEVQKIIQAATGKGDVKLVEVCHTVEEQRFKKVKEKLKENKDKPAGTFDAVELCHSIGAVELMDYEPSSARESRPITDGQRGALIKWGFDPAGVSCFGHASALLDRLSVRAAEGLASPKQVQFLKRLRHPRPEAATREEAGAWIASKKGAR